MLKTIKKILICIIFLSILTSCSLDDLKGYFGLDDKKEDVKPDEKPDRPKVEFENVLYDDFQIHFLELGNKYTGDSVYIKAGDLDILIDAGSRKNSAPAIKEYVDQYCEDGKLEYVISTHAHQDHIAGFVGLNDKTHESGKNGIFYTYSIDTLIDFSLTNQDSALYNEYIAARDYAISKGTIHYTAAEFFDESKDLSAKFVINDKISFEILYNFYYFHTSNDENNYSVVTMFTYDDNEKKNKFLFTGDLEKEGEEMMATYYDMDENKGIIDDVLLYKGGHHGSGTSSNDCLLSIIRPQICAVCCCAGSTEYTTYNDNTFPTQEFINRIAKYTDNVYVTSMLDDDGAFKPMNGTIVVSLGLNEEGLEKMSINATNNLKKLKDTEWFNKEIYVDDKGKLTTEDNVNAIKKPRRILPKEWQ